ncbi:hypothetical protein NQ317_016995 [Molorchus minor]|uniref:RNase H type-1 domain-containing protein n=1 Tax=Molorchus minor TaxID=1323400 RepID=A0ABQ9JJU2_9CUCU|nr:hypothetical protein NQ317_016995 [Molorchus minor]
MIPSQQVQYSGFVYDSCHMTVRLPKKKQKSILKQTNKGFIRYEDLEWWRSDVDGFTSLKPQKFVTEIFSDASRSRWGVVQAHWHWKDLEKLMHINSLELMAAYFGLNCFTDNLSNCSILLRIDNATAVAYVNRMGGTKYPHLHELARKLWQWCENRNIWVFASYIKSSNNIADRESRRLSPETEFELAQYAFNRICLLYFYPDIDLFASRSNTKCKKNFLWFKDPKSEAVDGLRVGVGDITEERTN